MKIWNMIPNLDKVGKIYGESQDDVKKYALVSKKMTKVQLKLWNDLQRIKNANVVTEDRWENESNDKTK